MIKNIDPNEKHWPWWKTFTMLKNIHHDKKTFTTLKNTHQDVGQNLPGKTLGQHQGQGWISRCDHAAEPCLEGLVIVIDIIDGSSLPMSLPSKSRFWSLLCKHTMPCRKYGWVLCRKICVLLNFGVWFVHLCRQFRVCWKIFWRALINDNSE